jgi:DNA-binding transcriptional regulator YdaS (Cro superfamily)
MTAFQITEKSVLNKPLTGSVPFQSALDIEAATSGQVTCYELVPRWEKVIEHCRRNNEINDISHVPCVNRLTTVLENKDTINSTQDKEDRG